MQSLSTSNRILILIAALLIIPSYFTPLWQISLWAPQYPEGLNMKIWIDHLSGNVDQINGVNHYIGMNHIGDEMFPEFTYLIYVIGVLIALGIGAALIGKRWSLYSFFSLISLFGLAVLGDMYRWGYQYGHTLDPKAAIKVEGMSYQPPLIGYKELLNFLAYSGPDTGSWILIGGVGLLMIAIIRDRFEKIPQVI
jgi:copper chaperone NosL